MALESLLGIGDLAGALTLAGIVASLPVVGHRGLLKEERKGGRSPKEKEFGPPEFEDFMRVWEGLRQVRASQHYGLSARNKNYVLPVDVKVRVASLCERAQWRRELQRKLTTLALKKNEREAESFYPGRGIPFTGKSTLTYVECKKVLKYMQRMGLFSHGQPIFEYAGHRDMLARAFAARVGKPNDAIVREDHRVVYEFFSLDVQQVLTEQGRYYLMKGCAEVTTDSKLGLAHIRLFQRWGTSPKQRGLDAEEAGPILAMDEEYEGHLFQQDDIVYALAFKSDRNALGRRVVGEADADSDKDVKIRRNMVSLVLSGFSRDSDGFHRKLTGGQLGQGIAGTVGVLSAPCVFYRVSEHRLAELRAEMQESDPKALARLSEGKAKESPSYEILKWDSAFIDLMNGVEQRYAQVMADLDVPMPIPNNDEEGGPDVFLVGKGHH